MRYLSIDLEATGLQQNDLMIEFAAIPFDASLRQLEHELIFHSYIKCPSFESLKPNLHEWVAEHNEDIINKAHQEGLGLSEFKTQFTNYLTSESLKTYFNDDKIILFGKSLNAIDLPFLNRDLGWNFMRTYFSHKVLDLSGVNFCLIDSEHIPEDVNSGAELMKYFSMGDVAHTALEDAINTAKLYFRVLEAMGLPLS